MQPHPYFQAIIDAYAASGRPPFHRGTPEQARAMLRASMLAAKAPVGLPPLAGIVDHTVDGPNGPIPVRRYLPDGGAIGTCVYLHSGGWVIGDLSSGDALCRRLAAAARCEMINVDYRLAPEHPFPAPLDDAYAVLLWAASRRAGPLLLAGESAGGNLAAACAIRARDTRGPALAGQLLAYPVTDAGMDTHSYRTLGDRDLLLSAADMRWFWDHYCPPRVDRADGLVSPLRTSDLSGLPSCLLLVASLDPLRDEGLLYASRLAEAGVAVRTREDAGMLHGYLNAAGAVAESAQAVDEAARWMAERCGAGP